MGLFNLPKSYDYRYEGKVVSVEGTNSIPLHVFLGVTLTGDEIVLKNSDILFNLRREQVTHAGTYTEQELIAKSKNAIGRGVAGAMLFGGTGTLIGTASGIGSKQKKKRHYYTSLSFTSSAGNACSIDFEVDELTIIGARKFNQAVMPISREAIQL